MFLEKWNLWFWLTIIGRPRTGSLVDVLALKFSYSDIIQNSQEETIVVINVKVYGHKHWINILMDDKHETWH